MFCQTKLQRQLGPNNLDWRAWGNASHFRTASPASCFSLGFRSGCRVTELAGAQTELTTKVRLSLIFLRAIRVFRRSLDDRETVLNIQSSPRLISLPSHRRLFDWMAQKLEFTGTLSSVILVGGLFIA
jgi:hypothetical protein